MVRAQSMSAGRGRLVRRCLLSAPRSVSTVALASRSISSLTTLATTRRAVSRVFSGIADLSATRSATRWTSASSVARNSGSSSICLSPSRSKASFWMTCTTGAGKNSRMSPSQRATLGADEPSPPRRAVPPVPPLPKSLVVERRQRGIDAAVAGVEPGVIAAEREPPAAQPLVR